MLCRNDASRIANRRSITAAVLFTLLPLLEPCVSAETPRQPPNVVLIMTDDQGWGDVGFHGNPQLKTPHLDRLAEQSVELTQFYVCPVCSPTRASLMTGRYNYRTGAIDTYLGRSTMVAEETTLAEMFAAAGYRTGIFGKWHLGDNYPSRPIDQGFAEALVHRGGGIGQPSDPPGNSYFDPVLLRNGHDVRTKGYCSDIFTDAAIDFMERHREGPFFIYLAFNCPHTPLEVPKEYHDRYRGKSLGEVTEKIYGMVANIDDNLGRLFGRMTELGLDEETIVVFLTDNGPQQPGRYNGGLRGLKASVYDGGIRVPCLVRWPGRLEGGRKIDQVAAHIDLAPTLLDACGIARPSGVAFDGVSLLPLLRGEQSSLPERLLFFQWHRGDEPRKYRACAVRGPRFKLVQPEGSFDKSEFTPEWALYDMLADPGERKNVIDAHPDVAANLKGAYEKWLADVGGTRGYPVPRIIVGTDRENPVTLTRQDWRGPRAGWNGKGLGHWDIEVAGAAQYDITLRIPAADAGRTAELQVGDGKWSQPLPAGAGGTTFENLQLSTGTFRLTASIKQGGDRVGAHYVDVLAHSVAAPKP
jgi:arylsulfatase A-like enzyme